ncbi:MAG: hypothetical protein ACFFAN_02325, partial [Promethearchaeota archaeon]
IIEIKSLIELHVLPIKTSIYPYKVKIKDFINNFKKKCQELGDFIKFIYLSKISPDTLKYYEFCRKSVLMHF